MKSKLRDRKPKDFNFGDFKPMDLALQQATLAQSQDEVPVGAVIMRGKQCIARAGNLTRKAFDPTAHAEMRVIRMACEVLQSERLSDCDLYVTLEPCAMCAAAISFARIRRLYFGAHDEKGGAVESGGRFFNQATCHHRPEVYSGIAEEESQKILKDFFKHKRI